jgi:Zn-dependent protease
VSSLATLDAQECPQCLHELPLGALACPQCHALIYRVHLDAIAKTARDFEARHEYAQARKEWNRALSMLPHDSRQAEWVRGHLQVLVSMVPPVAEAQPANRNAWAKRLGPFAPIAILLAKSKTLLLAIFKLKFLLSFFSFAGLYVMVFGWRFGIGFAASILIHEMGHFINVKRRGLPAEMPVFLPGLGAYVRWTGLGVTLRQRAQISLAGPLAGWVAASGCYLIYTQTHEPIWAALAHAGAFLNLLNLIPVWVLDGSQAMNALGMTERAGVLTVALALWIYTGQ